MTKPRWIKHEIFSCRKCGGTGRVFGAALKWVECRVCQGSGEMEKLTSVNGATRVRPRPKQPLYLEA